MPWNAPHTYLVLGGMAALVLGLPVVLYFLLTKSQRRKAREIRTRARERGWRFRKWQGNPSAFRIEGQTANGRPWIATTTNSPEIESRWSTELDVRFPTLAGEQDFSLMPRQPEDRNSLLASPVSSTDQARVATLSRFAAGTLQFLREAKEFSSGLPEFDAAYQILALPQCSVAPIDREMANRVLHWPSDATAPHSVIARRDALGLCWCVRLPGPPDWSTFLYFLGIAADASERLTPGAAIPDNVRTL